MTSVDASSGCIGSTEIACQHLSVSSLFSKRPAKVLQYVNFVGRRVEKAPCGQGRWERHVRRGLARGKGTEVLRVRLLCYGVEGTRGGVACGQLIGSGGALPLLETGP